LDERIVWRGLWSVGCVKENHKGLKEGTKFTKIYHVIPAEAGIQIDKRISLIIILDPCFRRDDRN
jgi:hypothetical protein